jgi:hypothetical protein
MLVLLPLMAAACEPPGEGGPVARWMAPEAVASTCPLWRGEHIIRIQGGHSPTTIAVQTHSGTCGSGSLLVSRDGGRSFERENAEWIVDIMADGTLVEIGRFPGMGLVRPDGSSLGMSPEPTGANAAVSGRGWFAVATDNRVWRTHDGHDWWGWRVRPEDDGANPPYGGPTDHLDKIEALHVADDGAVTLVRERWSAAAGSWIKVRLRGAPRSTELIEEPWQGEAPPSSLHAPPGSEWYYYTDRAGQGWAAHGPLALPLNLPVEPSQLISGYGHTMAITGSRLFAVEGAVMRRLDGLVPEGGDWTWAVTAEGHLLGADAGSIVRWSREAGWRTLLSCPQADRFVAEE